MQYFEFEDEFKNTLDMMALVEEDDTPLADNIIRWVISFFPPINTSEHIIEKDEYGKIIDTKGGVLLGKMTFQIIAPEEEEFTTDWFRLVKDEEHSPTTGIKINLDVTTYYQNQSTFRFTKDIKSKEVYLSNLIVSRDIEDKENQGQVIKKEYSLTPEFTKETLNYELELLEYLDTLDITAVAETENSTLKIKVPKRDEDGNLVYEEDRSYNFL